METVKTEAEGVLTKDGLNPFWKAKLENFFYKV